MNIAPNPHDAPPLDASAISALLECVPGPLLLLRSDGSVIFANAVAHALQAWIKSDDPSLDVAGALAPAMLELANDSGKHTTSVSLRRSPTHMRNYEVTVQRVSRADNLKQTRAAR